MSLSISGVIVEKILSIVELSNRSSIFLAKTCYEFLKTQGVNIAEVGNAPNKDTAETIIVHTPGNNLKAQLIGKILNISNIVEDPELVGADVAVILGNNAPQTWTQPAAEIPAQPSEPAPQPSPSAISAPTSGLFCPIP